MPIYPAPRLGVKQQKGLTAAPGQGLQGSRARPHQAVEPSKRLAPLLQRFHLVNYFPEELVFSNHVCCFGELLRIQVLTSFRKMHVHVSSISSMFELVRSEMREIPILSSFLAFGFMASWLHVLLFTHHPVGITEEFQFLAGMACSWPVKHRVCPCESFGWKQHIHRSISTLLQNLSFCLTNLLLQ